MITITCPQGHAVHLYTPEDAARILGVTPVRVRALATSRGLGQTATRSLRLFTADDIEAMRVRRPGRPPRRPDVDIDVDAG